MCESQRVYESVCVRVNVCMRVCVRESQSVYESVCA